QVPVVVDSRSFKLFASHFQLGVVEKDFPLARVQQPSRLSLLPHPAHKLIQKLAQSRHTLQGLPPQPFSHLRLIGKLLYSKKLARQRVLIQGFTVREAAASRA